MLARRLIERGVRCVQLYHQGWDQHGSLPRDLPRQCHETDRASAALVIDLEQRNAFPAVARPAGKSDALGMVAGIAIVAGLGLVTLWSMNSTRVAQ